MHSQYNFLYETSSAASFSVVTDYYEVGNKDTAKMEEDTLLLKDVPPELEASTDVIEVDLSMYDENFTQTDRTGQLLAPKEYPSVHLHEVQLTLGDHETFMPTDGVITQEPSIHEDTDISICLHEDDQATRMLPHQQPTTPLTDDLEVEFTPVVTTDQYSACFSTDHVKTDAAVYIEGSQFFAQKLVNLDSTKCSNLSGHTDSSYISIAEGSSVADCANLNSPTTYSLFDAEIL